MILDKYNDWTVIDSNPIKDSTGHKKLKCKCKCGLEKYVALCSLKCGDSRSCKSCSSKNTILSEAFKNTWKGKSIGKLSATLYGHIKGKATRRSRILEFNVTQEYLSNLFESQRGLCAISRLPISLSNKIKNGNPDFNCITASVDRIDSTKGYIEGNIQWVHKHINIMKHDFDMNYFINLCKEVAKY